MHDGHHRSDVETNLRRQFQKLGSWLELPKFEDLQPCQMTPEMEAVNGDYDQNEGGYAPQMNYR